MPRRILLIGEPAADRMALEVLLGREACEIVGEAAEGPAAIEAACRLQPDFAIVALDVVGESAAALLRGLAEAWPALRLIGIGSGGSGEGIETAFRAGLHGYVVRAKTASDLARALREVGRGNVFLSPLASRALVARYL